MQQSHDFICWNCAETFSHTIDPATKPTLLLDCPICDAQCSIDFAPYHAKVRDVLRGEQEIETERYLLPKKIPTQKITEHK